jgi:hypothetical protein
MTRRPVRGLALIKAPDVVLRPPGPTEILGPDGQQWQRHQDGLYYNEDCSEVFSQSALRDLIERSAERLERDIARTEGPVLRVIANARTVDQLRALWSLAAGPAARAHILGRRAVLELPPKEER